MSIGNEIKVARIAAKLSREDLALKIKRSYHTIKAWEIGRNTPPLATLERLEMLLNLKKGHFSAAEKEPPPPSFIALNDAILRLPTHKQQTLHKIIHHLSELIT